MCFFVPRIVCTATPYDMVFKPNSMVHVLQIILLIYGVFFVPRHNEKQMLLISPECAWLASGPLLARFWPARGSLLVCFWLASRSLLVRFWLASGSLLARSWSLLARSWLASGRLVVKDIV